MLQPFWAQAFRRGRCLIPSDLAVLSAQIEMPTMGARRPQINLSDVPETLPGARPSASSAQREAFEERCRRLYREEVEETGADGSDWEHLWG